MDAAQSGFTEIVAEMISAGADVNEQDNDGWTALLRAQQGHHKPVIDLLQAETRKTPGTRMCEICRVVWISPTGKFKDMGAMGNTRLH